MIPHTVLNQEFRDMTATCKWPLSDNATGGVSNWLPIPNELLLDGLLYVVGSFQAPAYIASMDGSYGTATQLLVTIKDSSNKTLCTGIMDTTTDTCMLKDIYGLQAGVFVYNPAMLGMILGQLTDLTATYSPGETELAAGITFVIPGRKGRTIVSSNCAYTRNVDIKAAGGVTFTVEGAGIAVNLYGEEPTGPMPVKSINGVVRDHIWLAAHPDSALRVRTDGTEIAITHKKDS